MPCPSETRLQGLGDNLLLRGLGCHDQVCSSHLWCAPRALCLPAPCRRQVDRVTAFDRVSLLDQDLADLSWSPDGSCLAVWDTNLDYKVRGGPNYQHPTGWTCQGEGGERRSSSKHGAPSGREAAIVRASSFPGSKELQVGVPPGVRRDMASVCLRCFLPGAAVHPGRGLSRQLQGLQ